MDVGHARARIVIRAVDIGTEAAPGTRAPLDPPVAILYDAGDIGAGEWLNTPGEIHWTLPGNHPQLSVIEPYLTHFALEIERDVVGWVEVLAGLVVDFDATDQEVVFYGSDYLGLLGRLHEERFNPKSADADYTKGGSKYSDKRISFIVQEQLKAAKALKYSPVGFITVPTIEDWPEKITINAVFKERLAFILGLMQSHAAGTGKRTRLKTVKTGALTYRWDAVDDPGVDRNDLRFEYGGLAQGFRIVPFDDFGTKVMGVGQAITGMTPMYAIAHPPDSSDTNEPFPEWRYGSFPKTMIWQDLIDKNDLKRRAALMARRTGKVGKKVGLGIRVDSLDVKVGWDICDAVPIEIIRGAVNTTAFGSGYYVIVGWEWKLARDGHTDLTLTFQPRDDDIAVDLTIVNSDSDPALISRQWGTGCGHPATIAAPAGLHFYYDHCSGLTYERGECVREGPAIIDDFSNRMITVGAQGTDTAWGLASGGARWHNVANANGAAGVDGRGVIRDTSGVQGTAWSLLLYTAAFPTHTATDFPLEMLGPHTGQVSFQTSFIPSTPGKGTHLKVELDLYDVTFGVATFAIHLYVNNTANNANGDSGKIELLGNAFPAPAAIAKTNWQANNTWYVVKWERGDDRFKVKVWAEAGAEPGWMFDVLFYDPMADEEDGTFELRTVTNQDSPPGPAEIDVLYRDLMATPLYVGDVGVPVEGTHPDWRLGKSWQAWPTLGDGPSTNISTSNASAGAEFNTTWEQGPPTGGPGAYSSYYRTTNFISLDLPSGANEVRLTGTITVTGPSFTFMEGNWGAGPPTGVFNWDIYPPTVIVDSAAPRASFSVPGPNVVPVGIFAPTSYVFDSGWMPIQTGKLFVTGPGGPWINTNAFEFAGTLTAQYRTGAGVAVPPTFDCWKQAIPTVFMPTAANPNPQPGQYIEERQIGVGNGVDAYFYLNINGYASPYQAGTVRVKVDGLRQDVAEADPDTGLILLDFVPLVGEKVYAEWRTKTAEVAVP